MYYCRDDLSLLALVGDDRESQAVALAAGPDIVVATPARLRSHLLVAAEGVAPASAAKRAKKGPARPAAAAAAEGGVLSLERVGHLVIDEADLALSYGHGEDVSAILRAMPKIYTGFLASATLSAELESLKVWKRARAMREGKPV